MDPTDLQLVVAFLDFLEHKKSASFSSEKDAAKLEAIEVACQCLDDIFDLDAAQRQRLSIAPTSLADIFKVFLNKRNALGNNTKKAESPEGKLAPQVVGDASQHVIDKAEQLKRQGNEALAAGQYEDAVAFYSQAIACRPNAAVYYSNRAAANAYLGRDLETVRDCEAAIQRDAKYVKAYTRLGQAHLKLGNIEAAIQTYDRALQLEPSNVAIQTSLQQARRRLEPSSSSSSCASPCEAGPSTTPGAFDLASMLQNPQMLKMMQDLSKNGGISELLKNPGVAQMAQSMLSKDPEALKNLAAAFGSNASSQ